MTTSRAAIAQRVVDRLGGRFSTELGIDLEGGDAEIERWFLVATLFGTRISTTIVERTARTFFDAGVRSIGDASALSRQKLVALLDAGGYARYDFRTADRISDLAHMVATRHGGHVSPLGRDLTDPVTLTKTLDALPGWGPVTVRVFLRELRGIWPGAALPLDERTLTTAHHLRLLPTRLSPRAGVEHLGQLALEAGIDRRDLEAALVRCSIVHARLGDCPGGSRCTALEP